MSPTVGVRRKGRSKHMTFWCYFMTFAIVFISVSLIDLIASSFYLVDYFRTISVNGLMNLLEIRNQDAIRPILEQVSFATRNVPPLIMFAGASKLVILFTINFFVISMFLKASWQVSKENEFMAVSSRTSVSTVSTIAPTPAHNVNVNVARAPNSISRATQPPDVQSPPSTFSKKKRHAPPIPDDESTTGHQPINEPQPPYNPYMTNQSKNETNF